MKALNYIGVACLFFVLTMNATAQAAAAECNTMSRYQTQNVSNVYLIDDGLSSMSGWTKNELIQAVQEALSVWNQLTEGPVFVYKGLGAVNDIPPRRTPCRGNCPNINTIHFRECDLSKEDFLGRVVPRCELNRGLCTGVVNRDYTRWHVEICINQPWEASTYIYGTSRDDLVSTLVHEFGHALGLGHPGPTSDPYCGGEASVMGSRACLATSVSQRTTRRRRPFVYDRECSVRKGGFRNLPLTGLKTTVATIDPLAIPTSYKGLNVSSFQGLIPNPTIAQGLALKKGNGTAGGVLSIIQTLYGGAALDLLHTTITLNATRNGATQTPMLSVQSDGAYHQLALFSLYTPQSDMTYWNQSLIPTARTFKPASYNYAVPTSSPSVDRTMRFEYFDSATQMFYLTLKPTLLGYDLRRMRLNVANSGVSSGPQEILEITRLIQGVDRKDGLLTAPGVACTNAMCYVFYISAMDPMRYIRLAKFTINSAGYLEPVTGTTGRGEELRTLSNQRLQSVSDISAWYLSGSGSTKRMYFAFIDSSQPDMWMRIGVLDLTTDKVSLLTTEGTAISSAASPSWIMPFSKVNVFWTVP